MCLLIRYIAVITGCVFTLVRGQGLPSTPCPDVFQYFQQPNGDVAGRITIPYDGSTTLNIGVNASMKGYYNGRVSLQIKLDTPGLDLVLQRTKDLRYSVNFPFQHSIPKITHIKLNDRGYCDGPPEKTNAGSPGVTNMWSEHRFFFETSNRNDEYTPPPPQPPTYPTYPTKNVEKPVTPIERFPEEISTSAPPIWTTKRYIESSTTNRNQNQFKECGVTKNMIVPYILGGTDITDGMYPWLAAMFVTDRYEYKCTANLISEKHVLTAARCINYFKLQVVKTELMLFVFGRSDLENFNTSGAVSRGAVKVQTHPEYNQDSGHGDISIITLDRPVQISETISPICLWSGSNDFTDIVGKLGTVAGWGADKDAQKTGKFNVFVAKSIEMPIVSNQDCLDSHINFYSLTSDMTFCAGQRDGTGTCFGDNGASFMMMKQGKYYLRGMASITINDSNGQCDLNSYMVFSDVAKFSNWIETSMRELDNNSI